MRIVTVCLGNICRSPIAQVVLSDELERAGVDGVVESGGTAAYHVGEPMDPRAASALRRVGLDPTQHRARRFTADWFARFDLVLAMDGSNLRDLTRLTAGVDDPPPIRRFREFDPAGGEDLDVADPYFEPDDTHAFDRTVAIARRTAQEIVHRVRQDS